MPNIPQESSTRSLHQAPKLGLPVLLGIFGVIFACFSPSLDNFFAGDDFSWFFHTLKTIHIPETFLLPVNNFYRQTESLYFLATTLAFGLAPLPFFLILVVIHGLNGILVSTLVTRVTGDRLAGVVGGLAWALCYKHAEVVLRPYAVADSAALLFGLASILLILKRRVVIAVLLLIPSLFAKENAILFPLLATILVFSTDGEKMKTRFSQLVGRWTRAVTLTSPLWALASAFALLEILGSRSSRYLSFDLAFVSRFWESWLTYLGPDATWLREVVLGGGPTLVPTWLAFVLFVPFAFLLWRVPRLVRLGVVWTCITMLPTLAVPFQSSRYHYVPLVGIALVFGLVWSRVYARLDRSPKDHRAGLVLLFSATALLAAFFISGIQNEERDTAQIGELHRRAAASFEAGIVPFLDREPSAMTVFMRTENLDIAHSLFNPRPWFMPETYKWVYRRPHGILGLADTYGFVSYCSYDPEQPSLFVAVPRREFEKRLGQDLFTVALHNSTTNVFSRGDRKVQDSARQMAAEHDSYSLLQPGRFDPTFRGKDRLSAGGP
ncbi:MAG: hypothetical protein ABFS37_03020 [Acidobacteriota bacterium]